MTRSSPTRRRFLRRIDALSGGLFTEGLDPRTRAEASLWEELADTHLNGFLVAARWADARNWPRTRAAYFGGMPPVVKWIVPGRLRAGVVKALVGRDVWRAGPDACWALFEQTLDALELRAPEEGYWLGKRLTFADLAIFPQLHGLRTALTPWQGEALAKRARLTAYLERVHRATWEPATREEARHAPSGSPVRHRPALASPSGDDGGGSRGRSRGVASNGLPRHP